MLNLKLIKKKINRKNYISRSQKISFALKDILKTTSIGILDVGAGHRYLPILLNFDGVSKIAMIDPSRSLEWSYKNFKKIVRYPQNLYKFNFGISDKTSRKRYYVTNTITGSTFSDIYKIAKKNKKKLDREYFGKKKSITQQVYSIKDFKKFFKYGIDIIKIDVEGHETKIIDSVLKNSEPLLIEVETNLNSEIYPNSFSDINAKLIRRNYKLVTAYPIFKKVKKNLSDSYPFESGSYDNPIVRLPLEQFECIYIKNKKNFNTKDISIFLGYGLFYEVKKFLRQSRINSKKDEILKIKNFLKNFFN